MATAVAVKPSVAAERVTLDEKRSYQVVPTQGGWLVSSATQEGFWKVRESQGSQGRTCACPGWIWRGHCRHLAAVAAVLAVAS